MGRASQEAAGNQAARPPQDVVDRERSGEKPKAKDSDCTRAHQFVKTAGVPGFTIWESSDTSQLVNRMQP